MGILRVTNLEDDMFNPLLLALEEIGPIKSYQEYDGGDVDFEFEEEDHLQKAIDQIDELNHRIHGNISIAPKWKNVSTNK